VRWGGLALGAALALAALAALALWDGGGGSGGQAPSRAALAPPATVTHMGEVVVLRQGGVRAAVTVWNPHSVAAGTALDVRVDWATGSGRLDLAWDLVLPDGTVHQPLPATPPASAGQPATAPLVFAVPLEATEGGAVRAAAGSAVATWRLG
jgi:hypothetical protein